MLERKGIYVWVLQLMSMKKTNPPIKTTAPPPCDVINDRSLKVARYSFQKIKL